MKDGSIMLGTISEGIIHMSQDGSFKFQINQDNGLSNNTVLSLFEDLEQNIWLGLDNGINCLNVNSPFQIYNDFKGELGSVYTSAVYNNTLYLGTNQGLYFRALNSNQDFTFIEGTQGQVWCLIEHQSTLFCGHNSGTYIIKDNRAQKISDVQGTWNIKPIDQNPDLLLQGNYNGLNILVKIGTSWVYRNKIEGFDISSRFFEHYDNKVFVNHEY